jgi:hypothetical protein
VGTYWTLWGRDWNRNRDWDGGRRRRNVSFLEAFYVENRTQIIIKIISMPSTIFDKVISADM